MTEPHRAPDQPTNTSAAQSVETRTRVLWLDGVRWIVRETDQPTLDRRAGRSLIFESDEIVRRLRKHPADWFALSDDALCRLSLGRLASDP